MTERNTARARTSGSLGSYHGVPEFVCGITREIWEDRGIGRKSDKYYAKDILLRAPTGLTVGNSGVTAQTLQTLRQFPDRTLVGEDVIRSACPQASYLSSHRLISVMTHAEEGIFGAPSGRVVCSRIIADCWIQGQQILEEWLVPDQVAFALCLGLEPRALALSIVEREVRNGESVSYFLPPQDRSGACVPSIADDEMVALYITGLQRIWQHKETAAVRDLYFRGAALHGPGGNTRHGHADIDRFFLGYLASFPDASFAVHSAIGNREPERPVRLAIRWSLTGRHTGFGHFGAPTGADVYAMGMTHASLTDSKVRTEWLLTDEVSIWKQIHAHAQRSAGA